ncbi:hypothetical protein TCAL_15142 [Tigriopus californicus]|uniref:Uncharacterized protein n=1 Tax=Tigriopus californicus TaxID=6832 RepID=A0A553NVD3_TIGCA|nr:hypothetical protein TCAL_15142 [Tigriopus californicus]
MSLSSSWAEMCMELVQIWRRSHSVVVAGILNISDREDLFIYLKEHTSNLISVTCQAYLNKPDREEYQIH